MGSTQKEKLKITNNKVIDYPYCELKSDLQIFFYYLIVIYILAVIPGLLIYQGYLKDIYLI